MIFLISSTNAGLHEEGGDEGGNSGNTIDVTVGL